MEFIGYSFIFAAAVLFGFARRFLFGSERRDDAGYWEFMTLKIDYDQRAFDERLAENMRRRRECVAIEDAAWRKREWELETLEAWWDLFCDVHAIPFRGCMYNYPYQFRKHHAILIEGSHEQWWFPELPEPLHSPQLMWWEWEEMLSRPKPAN